MRLVTLSALHRSEYAPVDELGKVRRPGRSWYTLAMVHVCFTNNLRRHVACPEEEVVGDTLGAVLAAYFVRHPQARGYILDEHGALRRHVVAFVGGQPATDRATLQDRVADGSEVWIMQALSGG